MSESNIENGNGRTAKRFAWGLSAVAAVVAVAGFFALRPEAGAATSDQTTASVARDLQAQGDWATDPIWYDGLVEKAVYDASRVVYGHPRQYEAVFLTNKENHEPSSWTKDPDNEGPVVEVWKHNQIEVIPTPNYDYKYEATSHLTTGELSLTRLDVSSQEWCGTTFKQYQVKGTDGRPSWDYFGFSYMPGEGRTQATVTQDGQPVVPFNALPLFLRGYDFQSRQPLTVSLLPDQKTNKTAPAKPVEATVTFAEETQDGYVLEVRANDELLGTYTMAKDRQHVMLSFEGPGQSYTLKSLDRIDYWTRHED